SKSSSTSSNSSNRSSESQKKSTGAEQPGSDLTVKSANSYYFAKQPQQQQSNGGHKDNGHIYENLVTVPADTKETPRPGQIVEALITPAKHRAQQIPPPVPLRLAPSL